MKPWQVVLLLWIAAAFAGIVVAQFSTNALFDLGVAAGLTLLGVLLIRRSKPGSSQK